eukprot:4778759-Alexandrium_andersonii.AAC.1
MRLHKWPASRAGRPEDEILPTSVASRLWDHPLSGWCALRAACLWGRPLTLRPASGAANVAAHSAA